MYILLGGLQHDNASDYAAVFYCKIVKYCSGGGAEDTIVESDEESDDEAPPIPLAQNRTGKVVRFN